MNGAGDAIEQLLAAIDTGTGHYEAGSAKYFSLFTADATFFSSSEALRIDGRKAFQRLLGPGMTAQRRAYHMLDKQVQMLSDRSAVVTSHVRFRVNLNFVDMRMTLVMVRRRATWKCAHLHMSPLASGASTATHGLVEDVTRLR